MSVLYILLFSNPRFRDRPVLWRGHVSDMGPGTDVQAGRSEDAEAAA